MTQFRDPPTQTVDAIALARFLDAAGLPGEGELPTLRALGGGSQNELTLVERGDARMVMRKPPISAVADRVEGMRREHRLAQALAGSEVPHPRYLAGSDDAAILGMPFFLMEAIDGWSPVAGGSWESPYDVDFAARHGIGLELARGAASMARFDWKGHGLEGFGRPDNFHERQVDRWLAYYARIRCRELPGLDEAAVWLRGHTPRHWTPGLMHGDYQLANVMFAHGAPAKLLAIIDWEMATIGDPLLDLGWVLVAWGPEAADMQHAGFMQAPGLPTRDEMLAHYEKHSGRSTESIDYYVVLARWKLGIVLEQSYSRLLQGAGVNPRVEFFGNLVPELIRKAASLAASIP
ncbi:phosphotransferase family protein [Myxococcota bacterium]|nr:phosphotransferase family protein [Myxococcota bacterium]